MNENMFWKLTNQWSESGQIGVTNHNVKNVNSTYNLIRTRHCVHFNVFTKYFLFSIVFRSNVPSSRLDRHLIRIVDIRVQIDWTKVIRSNNRQIKKSTGTILECDKAWNRFKGDRKRICYEMFMYTSSLSSRLNRKKRSKMKKHVGAQTCMS